MHIVLDTTAIHKDFHLRGAYLRVLSAANQAGLSVSIPEVVFDEFTNQYREELQERWSRLDKAAGEFRQLLGPPDPVPFARPDLAKMHTDYCAQLKAKLKELNVELLPYPQTDHRHITKRDLARRKPFERTGKGYRDTLTWECILELAKKGEEIVFITANHNDFGFPLHLDLISDLTKAGIPTSAVTIIKTVDEAIAAHLQPILRKLDQLVQDINARGPKNTAIRSWLKREIPSLIPSHSIPSTEVGFSADHIWTTLKSVHVVSDLTVSEANKLQTGEIFIKGRTTLEANFEAVLVVEPPDEAGVLISLGLSPSSDPELISDESTAVVEIEFSAVLDSDETSVVSASVVSLNTVVPEPDHY